MNLGIGCAPASIPPIQSRGATIRARGEVPQRIAGPIKAGMLASSAARSDLRLQLSSLQRRPLRADRALPPPLPPPPRLRLLLQRHRHPSPLSPSAEMELARRRSPPLSPPPSRLRRPRPRRRASSFSPRRRPTRRQRIRYRISCPSPPPSLPTCSPSTPSRRSAVLRHSGDRPAPHHALSVGLTMGRSAIGMALSLLVVAGATPTAAGMLWCRMRSGQWIELQHEPNAPPSKRSGSR